MVLIRQLIILFCFTAGAVVSPAQSIIERPTLIASVALVEPAGGWPAGYQSMPTAPLSTKSGAIWVQHESAESLWARLQLLKNADPSAGGSKYLQAFATLPYALFHNQYIEPSSALIYEALGLFKIAFYAPRTNQIDTHEFWRRLYIEKSGSNGRIIGYELRAKTDIWPDINNTRVAAQERSPNQFIPRLARAGHFALLHNGRVMDSQRAQQLNVILQLLTTNYLTVAQSASRLLIKIAFSAIPIVNLNVTDGEALKLLQRLDLVDSEGRLLNNEDAEFFKAAIRLPLSTSTLYVRPINGTASAKLILNPAFTIRSPLARLEVSEQHVRCVNLFN